MLGSLTHACLIWLNEQATSFLLYKDTSHNLTGCIIVDMKLLSGSGKANTYVLLQPLLGLLQTFTWGLLIQTNLKASLVALPKSWWSWINFPWTSDRILLFQGTPRHSYILGWVTTKLIINFLEFFFLFLPLKKHIPRRELPSTRLTC